LIDLKNNCGINHEFTLRCPIAVPIVAPKTPIFGIRIIEKNIFNNNSINEPFILSLKNPKAFTNTVLTPTINR